MAEFDKSLEELVGVCGAHDRVDGLVRSILNQSVGALDEFINRVVVQMVGRFRSSLADAFAGSHFPFPYTLTHVSGIRATGVEMQSPARPSEEAMCSAGTNP